MLFPHPKLLELPNPPLVPLDPNLLVVLWFWLLSRFPNRELLSSRLKLVPPVPQEEKLDSPPRPPVKGLDLELPPPYTKGLYFPAVVSFEVELPNQF